MAGDLFAKAYAEVLRALAVRHPELEAAVKARVEVVPARQPEHGDMATNAALVAAKGTGLTPRALAQDLAEALAARPLFAAAVPAGPGFINLRLRPDVLRAELSLILASGTNYGDAAPKGASAVNVEYVSANPTGPLHVGHCRGAVVGDALANLLCKAGYSVTKEYYINDAGAQVEALAWAAYWRYLEALGEAVSAEEFSAHTPGGLQYQGEYLVPVGHALAEKYARTLVGSSLLAPTEQTIALIRDFTIARMMRAIREDLALLGVVPDVFTSERTLLESGAVDRAIGRLHALGLIYEGTLAPPRGKLPDDWEPRRQTLFRASAMGDETDRPLRKSDGSNTYFANDIAYHADKIRRGAGTLIDVLGADHGGYVRRMRAAVAALSEHAKFEVVLCQIVRVVRAGKPVRMSKRAGNYVTLRELLEEVGRDAVRFTMLMRKADAQMEFDLDRAVAQTRENPVFYVQYAHARCRSVLRAAAAALGAENTTDQALSRVSLEPLTQPTEIAVIRRLITFPHLVEAAAAAREPHRIAFFLYDLASDFHILWNQGREDPSFRFLQTDRPDETAARLALVAATAVVLRAGLGILGVAPVEEMR